MTVAVTDPKSGDPGHASPADELELKAKVGGILNRRVASVWR